MENKVLTLYNQLCYLKDKKEKIISKKNFKLFIYNKKIPKTNNFFWPKGLIINSLVDYNDKKSVDLLLGLWEKEKCKIVSFDDSLAVYGFMRYDSKFQNRVVIKLCENMYDKVIKYKNNIIPYKDSEQNYAYIDLIGMICPFLSLYGVQKKDRSIMDWSIQQILEFVRYAKDKQTGLLYHGYNINTKEKMGLLCWGRGYGWITYGIVETLAIISKSHNEYEKLKNIYIDIIESILKFQNNDGGFSWQINAMDGHSDTSATAMIIYSLLKAKKLNILNDNFDKVIHNGMINLNKNTDIDGVTSCSCECGGFGIYPQKYGKYIWSLAPTLSCYILYGDIYE